MQITGERLLYDLAIPLAKLAEFDNFPSSGALADAVGDRYLYRHNLFFANIRDSALRSGYRYSTKDTPMWRDYQSLGLTTLHRILSSKTIPYYDTGNTLGRLLKSNPRVALSPGFILSNLKSNHTFHESAHCVAYSVFQRIEPDLKMVAPCERERLVLEATLAESFANTVEVLGTLSRGMPLADTLFYRLNSYMAPEEKQTAILQKAGEEFGANLRFTLLFLASFEANITAGKPDDITCQRIASAANCTNEHTEVASLLTNEGFGLNAGFRQNTTPAYFELLGYKTEYTALTQSAWLGKTNNQSFVRDLIQILFETATVSCS
jgi:hypothetical protein